MAEEADTQGRTAPVSSEAGAPAWAALGAASGPKADAFLEQQTQLASEQLRLARLQADDLERDEIARRWSLWFANLSAAMKVAFEFALAAIFVAIALAVVAAVWVALHDNGLVIESFKVPPDLAQRGLTGDVVASQLLDRLAVMQADTTSNRAAASYANNWGDDIKVQVPETGVSLGDIDRFLRAWLGHETRISGEIYRDATGIAVTARAGSDASPTFHGSDAELPKMIQSAAEAVYRNTQPYRYAIYLDNHGRAAESRAIYQSLIDGESPVERAWAYIGLASEMSSRGDFVGADVLLRRAIAAEPNVLLSYDNIANNEGTLQHDEPALAASREALALEERGRDPSMGPADFSIHALQDQASVAGTLGDYRAEIKIDHQIEAGPNRGSWEGAYQSDSNACGALHDPACLRALETAMPPTKDPVLLTVRRAVDHLAQAALGHWRVVVDQAPAIESSMKNLPGLAKVGDIFLRRTGYPLDALALAQLGNFKAAHAMIDKTPPDCGICLRTRGRIDTLERNWGGARYWFNRAVETSPSIPDAYTYWGEMLLKKGDYGAAIALFAVAHKKGSHFADPLEMWGEALMNQNRSDLALAKFEEAANDAPNWGRLHLKWGEALFYAARADEAKEQFRIAESLELNAKEKAELKNFIRA